MLRGTGAVTTILGIGMHGHITVLGDSTDGITTTAGTMTTGTMEDGTTHGTTAAPGDSTIHGTMADGTEVGTHTTHIMLDGTAESDGIRTIITTIIMDISITLEDLQTRIISEARDIRPAQKDFLQAEAALSEADQV